jgi:hypothetical protein
VTAVTAIGNVSWFIATTGETVMTRMRMYDSWSIALPIDDRDERPLLIALVAIVAAWSLALLLAL